MKRERKGGRGREGGRKGRKKGGRKGGREEGREREEKGGGGKGSKHLFITASRKRMPIYGIHVEGTFLGWRCGRG